MVLVSDKPISIIVLVGLIVMVGHFLHAGKPTVCLHVTSLVASSCGYDNGKSGPTHCALIGAARGDRCNQCWVCRTPPAGARSAHSGLAAGSRLVSTAAPGGFPRSRTTPRSASTPCGDASPPRSAPGTRPCPLHPCLS